MLSFGDKCVIVHLYATNKFTMHQIGAMYGVTSGGVSVIVRTHEAAVAQVAAMPCVTSDFVPSATITMTRPMEPAITEPDIACVPTPLSVTPYTSACTPLGVMPWYNMPIKTPGCFHIGVESLDGNVQANSTTANSPTVKMHVMLPYKANVSDTLSINKTTSLDGNVQANSTTANSPTVKMHVMLPYAVQANVSDTLSINETTSVGSKRVRNHRVFATDEEEVVFREKKRVYQQGYRDRKIREEKERTVFWERVVATL